MYSNTILFGPVGPEMLIILLIIILLFGANRIPKLARSTGEAIGEFRRGREGDTEPTTDSEPKGSTTTEQTDTETARADQ